MKNKMLMTMAAAAIMASAPAFAEQGKDGMKKEGMMGMHKGMMFEAMDANGDGMVSKDEFMADHMKRFDKMDANHDGNVSKEEIEVYRAAKKAERESMKKDGADTAAPAADQPADE